jgi:ribosomal protein L16 Arg81 hydroxylase
VSAIAFCSPPRARVAFLPHFDPFDSFSVHLHGCKTWDIGGNLDVAHPFHPWPMSAIERDEPEARAYMPAAWHPDTRARMQRVVMRPGSVMFIGRGCWHGTGEVGDEPSIALSFVFTTDTLSAIVRQALAVVMAGDAEWREPGVGMLLPGAARADAEQRLAARVERLRGLLAAISPGELLDAYARASSAPEVR